MILFHILDRSMNNQGQFSVFLDIHDFVH